jgi:H+-translocating NAD(P) transhydrogenase subunit beta
MNFTTLVQASYFLAALMLILGLKRMSSPVSARQGMVQIGIGTLIASVVTFAFYVQPVDDGPMFVHTSNLILCVVAIAIGTSVAWISGKRGAMTELPQMLALYNGMGGGSAAAIGAVELFKAAAIAAAAASIADMSQAASDFGFIRALLALAGALLGAVSFSGSMIAFAKLRGWMDKAYRFRGQQAFNLLLFLAAMVLGVMIIFQLDERLIVAFFVVGLALGVSLTLPIGGADMPLVSSLYNASTGFAVALEGYVLQNPVLIIAGMVVGAAGIRLTQSMARATGHPIAAVLFSNLGGANAAQEKIIG